MYPKKIARTVILLLLITVCNAGILLAQQDNDMDSTSINNGDSVSQTTDTLDSKKKKGFFKRLFTLSDTRKRKKSENDIDVTLREQKRKTEQLNNRYFEAATNSNDQLMVELLKQGADINTKNEHGRTALIEAARTGDHQVVKTLIELGASINVKDNYDATALAYANRNRDPGNPEIVLLLLRNNAVK